MTLLEKFYLPKLTQGEIFLNLNKLTTIKVFQCFKNLRLLNAYTHTRTQTHHKSQT